MNFNFDDIYFPQIREYFEEVYSSYASKNYRSAVVMLYSVTVCDILLKLQELRDMYNDGIANQILEDVDKSRKAGERLGGSKSEWEKKLIDSVHDKTAFFDTESYLTVEHLYDYRCMCAHPAVNASYELYKPDGTTVIALINEILRTVLCKPPIYVKDVFNTLTDDLAAKYQDLSNDREHLGIYLDNRYFNRMSPDMKLAIAKKLWKITFILDNEKCNKNRLINRRAMELLTDEIKDEFCKQIKADVTHYNVSDNENIKMHFVIYLSRCPEVYDVLGDEVKLFVDKFIKRNNTAKCISWFKYGSVVELLGELDVSQNMRQNLVEYMYSQYTLCGFQSELLDFFVRYFSESNSYQAANFRYFSSIIPYLKYMSERQLMEIVKAVDSNDQIYGCWESKKYNAEIVYYLRHITGETCDCLNDYNNFKFDEKDVKLYEKSMTEDGPSPSDELRKLNLHAELME